MAARHTSSVARRRSPARKARPANASLLTADLPLACMTVCHQSPASRLTLPGARLRHHLPRDLHPDLIQQSCCCTHV